MKSHSDGVAFLLQRIGYAIFSKIATLGDTKIVN